MVPSNCFDIFVEDKKDVVAALKSSGNEDIKPVGDFKVFSLKKKNIFPNRSVKKYLGHNATYSMSNTFSD